MLQITVPALEQWDEENQEFINTKAQTLTLEHSLVSLSKWEAKWHKPFLSTKEKTYEETMDYIKCMTLTQNVDPNVYKALSDENIHAVNKYIEDPMTATTFGEQKKGRKSSETITSELIYYWMISLNIPVEFQKWHLNRLLTLIEVCNRKNEPPKKMGQGDIMKQNAALNAARRKKLNTRG